MQYVVKLQTWEAIQKLAYSPPIFHIFHNGFIHTHSVVTYFIVLYLVTSFIIIMHDTISLAQHGWCYLNNVPTMNQQKITVLLT